MTDTEILKKAIEKSSKNGFYNKYFLYNGWEVMPDDLESPWIKCGEGANFDAFTIIFSHNFAKAFWGEGEHIFDGEIPSCEICDIEYLSMSNSYCWQAHLQQMVLEENPIRYLEKYL